MALVRTAPNDGDAVSAAQMRRCAVRGPSLGSRLAVVVKRAAQLFVLIVAIKSMLFVSNGPGAYSARIDRLEHGILVERVAARILHLDPVTEQVIQTIRFGLS